MSAPAWVHRLTQHAPKREKSAAAADDATEELVMCGNAFDGAKKETLLAKLLPAVPAKKFVRKKPRKRRVARRKTKALRAAAGEQQQQPKSHLQFGRAPVLGADCASCAVDATLWSDGAEARGLVHSLYALKEFFSALFVLYRDAFAKRSVDTRDANCAAQRDFRALLTRFGIALDARCSALIEPFETARPLRRSRAEQTRALLVCPNVCAVLSEAWRAICGERGALSADAQTFFEQVLLETLVYWHEAAQRRRRDESSAAAVATTLASCEREYKSAAAQSAEIYALHLQRDNGAFLAAHDEFVANQSSALTRVRDTLHESVAAAAAGVADAALDDGRAPRADERFCALLRSPLVEPSYREYCWPGKLSFTMDGYRIEDEECAPQLVCVRAAPAAAPNSAKKRQKKASVQRQSSGTTLADAARASLMPPLLSDVRESLRDLPPLSPQAPSASVASSPLARSLSDTNELTTFSLNNLSFDTTFEPPQFDQMSDTSLRLAFSNQGAVFMMNPPPLDRVNVHGAASFFDSTEDVRALPLSPTRRRHH